MPAAIDEFHASDHAFSHAHLVGRDRPLVIRGLCGDWPVVMGCTRIGHRLRQAPGRLRQRHRRRHATSIAQLDQVDGPRFPRLRQALEHLLASDLQPGDAICMPPLWWHHHAVSLEPLNALVNYW